MKADLPAELALVVACCRWPPSPAREAAVRAAASGPIDWDRFDRVVARHRVAALARAGLHSAGVSRAARRRTAPGRRCRSIQPHRIGNGARDGSPAAHVRGGRIAGALPQGLDPRSACLRHAWRKAIVGYRCADHAGSRTCRTAFAHGPGLPGIWLGDVDEGKFPRFSEFANQAAFFNAALDTSVELHWRIIRNDQLIPDIGAHSPAQAVPIAGVGVRTLQDEPLFAYLCAHGTWHGWRRLKWLADLGAFLARRDQAEVERLYRAAIDLGAGRTPAVALLLCHLLLGLPLSDALLRELRADRVTTALVANSLYCMSYGRGEAEYFGSSVPGMRIKVASLFLAPGHRFFWSQVRTKLTDAGVRATMELPRPLAFLYYLLRVPLWLTRQRRSDR
jgi:hypothetical protein